MLYYHVIQTATAMAPPPEGAPDTGGHTAIMLLFYGGLFAIFYFLLIRPQTKRNRELRNMQDSLNKGDSVITSGGLYGVVHKVKDEAVTVEIAEGVRVKVQKGAITERAREAAAGAEEKGGKDKPGK
ncbi:MAG: preprotein translocase subunit YajC [Candidatus Nitrospinota bacterium M3_3B_026]